MTLLHTFFLGFAAVGYDVLWGKFIRNGTAKAIGSIKDSGFLPDGNVLRQVYTTFPSIDRLLISPVLFYDGLMCERDPTYRSLLVSLFSTMQTTSFCMISTGWIYGFPRWRTIM